MITIQQYQHEPLTIHVMRDYRKAMTYHLTARSWARLIKLLGDGRYVKFYNRLMVEKLPASVEYEEIYGREWVVS